MINPWHACAARVTVLGLCVCVCVCVCVYAYFHTTGNEADDERYQQWLLCYKRSKNKMAIFLKRLRFRLRNWQCRLHMRIHTAVHAFNQAKWHKT